MEKIPLNINMETQAEQSIINNKNLLDKHLKDKSNYDYEWINNPPKEPEKSLFEIYDTATLLYDIWGY
jgi:hypothetical protein